MRRAFKIGSFAIGAAIVTSCTLSHPLDRYQAGGAEDAGPDTSSPADAGPSWKRYQFSRQVDTWSDPVALAEIWTGPNAPPPRGIAAAVELTDEARLLVFGDDGMFYLQVDGVWRTPQPLATAFAPMTGVPESVYQVPHTFGASLGDGGGPDEEGLTFVITPSFFQFRYLPNDAIIFDRAGTIPTEDGGPPHDGTNVVWDFETLDLGAADPADRFKVVTLYDNGIIYELLASGAFRSFPIADYPMWKRPDPPPTTGLTAAYYSYATQSVSFIGP